MSHKLPDNDLAALSAIDLATPFRLLPLENGRFRIYSGHQEGKEHLATLAPSELSPFFQRAWTQALELHNSREEAERLAALQYPKKRAVQRAATPAAKEELDSLLGDLEF